MMGFMNRLGCARNQYQGHYKKVLCICSAGCLRSPTAAVVLAGEPFNFNTRAAGVEKDYAIVHADQLLVTWADMLVLMEHRHLHSLKQQWGDELVNSKQIVVLNIPDNYEYRNPDLMKLIKESFIAETNWSPEPKGEIVPEV